MKASAERTGRWYYSTVYNESTPDGDPSRIDDLHSLGNQMTWMCQCPHCRSYQELRFFTYRDGPHGGCGGVVGYRGNDGSSLLPIDEIRRSAYYRCINGCRVDNDAKQLMVRQGLWLPKGQRVDSHGNISGEPAKSRRHISGHLWKLHIPSVTAADVAVGYAEAYETGGLADYFQNTLGLKYVSARPMPEWSKIGLAKASDYDRGRVPENVYFLTAGIDVQEHGCYWVVCGWGDRASCWVIDWGYVRRYKGAEQLHDDEDGEIGAFDLATDLSQLTTAVLKNVFPCQAGVETPLGKRRLYVRLAGIDSNYRTHQVHEFVTVYNLADQNSDKTLRCVRGDHKIRGQQKFRMQVIDRPQRGGREYAGGLEQWGVYTSAYKDEIYDRLVLKKDEPGTILLPRGMSRIGKDFLKQLMNERAVRGKDRQGRSTIQWEVRNDRIGNHYLDGMVYARACAEMHLSRLQLTWEARKWKRSPQTHSTQSAAQPPVISVAAREHMR